MEIDWERLDYEQRFKLIEAACYWLEVEPIDEASQEIPQDVRQIYQGLYDFLNPPSAVQVNVVHQDHPTGYRSIRGFERVVTSTPIRTSITRIELIQFANQLNQKPKFLFPESRITVPLRKQAEDEQINPRTMNKYLAVISTLLFYLNKFDSKSHKKPGEHGFVKQLTKWVELMGYQGPRWQAISNLLNEVDLDQLLKEVESYEAENGNPTKNPKS